MLGGPVCRTYLGCLVCVLHLFNVYCRSTTARILEQEDRLFDQIAADLAPFKAGITKAMVDNSYCDTTDPGFRLQVKDGEMYLVGEVFGFQSRNRNIKLALLEIASHFHDLPDVDLVLGSDDFASQSLTSQGPILCQVWHRELIWSSRHVCANFCLSACS